MVIVLTSARLGYLFNVFIKMMAIDHRKYQMIIWPPHYLVFLS